jgi:hypothetical protein
MKKINMKNKEKEKGGKKEGEGRNSGKKGGVVRGRVEGRVHSLGGGLVWGRLRFYRHGGSLGFIGALVTKVAVLFFESFCACNEFEEVGKHL